MSSLFLVSFVDESGDEVLVGAGATEEEVSQVIARREQQRLSEIVKPGSVAPDSPEHERLMREVKRRLSQYRSVRA